MAIIKCKAVRDNSSHWYIIPETMYDEFFELEAKVEDDNYQNPELLHNFELKFSGYRIGGDLNRIQLYADL